MELWCNVRDFVGAFRGAGLRLIVFFDGGVDDAKLDEWLSRRKRDLTNCDKVPQCLQRGEAHPTPTLTLTPTLTPTLSPTQSPTLTLTRTVTLSPTLTPARTAPYNQARRRRASEAQRRSSAIETKRQRRANHNTPPQQQPPQPHKGKAKRAPPPPRVVEAVLGSNPNPYP